MIVLRPTFANLRRRPGRTLLTALGTALGIATIVALLAVADGAKRTAGDLVHLGDSDLGLFQKDAADPTTSVLPLSLVPRLRALPQVADATPLQLLVEEVKRDPAAIVFGIDPNGFEGRRFVYSAGRAVRAGNEIAVGDDLAKELGVHVGSTLPVHGRPFRVVGIYHVGILFQDRGAVMPLRSAQALRGSPGVTTIAVKLAPDVHAKTAGPLLERRFPGLQVIADPEEASRAGANGQLIEKAALVIVVLALIIGGIGVANTMLMSVVERRAEFALLSAIGYSGPQIAGLVLVEGVIVSLVGAAIGLVLGVFGADLLVGALGAEAFVSPDFTAWGMGRGLLVGILIGVLGGLYPAWRAAHLSPARILAQR
jgi:putative ABC transport system permease protein